MVRNKLARVYNPGRTISAGKKVKNPVRKTSARINPTRKRRVVSAASASRRRSVRRRTNPASITGLLGAALIAGLGITAFDLLTTRIVPTQSQWVRVGVKFGGAALFSMFGQKIPVLGKYKNEIALVLAVTGVVDLAKTLLVPTLDQFTGGLLMGGGGARAALPAVVAVPASDNAEMSGDYEYYEISESDDYEDDDDEY